MPSNFIRRYMWTSKTIIALIIIWGFTSCYSKETNNQKDYTMTLQSDQDTLNKTFRQRIANKVTEFSYWDFYDLKNNKDYDRFFTGNLTLPTGQVVCTDPLYRELGLPQSWTVIPGDYPVFLYIGIHGDFAGRVAYAELNIRDEIPTYWELSLISEALLENDSEKAINGIYPVENGLGSFSDFETFRFYNQEIKDFYDLYEDGNYYDDVLEQYFKENANIPPSSRGEDWINYKPAKANGNIIMFGSGWGDNLYLRYVSYNKNGQVVKLITDFIQLVGSIDEGE